jgi:hypothetical protein
MFAWRERLVADPRVAFADHAHAVALGKPASTISCVRGFRVSRLMTMLIPRDTVPVCEALTNVHARVGARAVAHGGLPVSPRLGARRPCRPCRCGDPSHTRCRSMRPVGGNSYPAIMGSPSPSAATPARSALGAGRSEGGQPNRTRRLASRRPGSLDRQSSLIPFSPPAVPVCVGSRPPHRSVLEYVCIGSVSIVRNA